MNSLIEFLKWIGVVMLGLIALLFVAGFALGIIRTFRNVVGVKKMGAIESLLETTGAVSRKLRPWQVWQIAAWYISWLGGLVYVLYELGLGQSPPEALKLAAGSPTARYLLVCFAAGGIGAIVYGMLWISKTNVEEEKRWLLRRYMFLPILGCFLGSASFLFVKTGLITLQSGGATNGGKVESDYAIYGIAFLSGFASRELTAKLIKIAEAMFIEAPESSPTRDSSNPAPPDEGEADAAGSGGDGTPGEVPSDPKQEPESVRNP
jgi:hypothetical protein